MINNPKSIIHAERGSRLELNFINGAYESIEFDSYTMTADGTPTEVIDTTGAVYPMSSILAYRVVSPPKKEPVIEIRVVAPGIWEELSTDSKLWPWANTVLAVTGSMYIEYRETGFSPVVKLRVRKVIK